jgi:hypothetical protein
MLFLMRRDILPDSIILYYLKSLLISHGPMIKILDSAYMVSGGLFAFLLNVVGGSLVN